MEQRRNVNLLQDILCPVLEPHAAVQNCAKSQLVNVILRLEGHQRIIGACNMAGDKILQGQIVAPGERNARTQSSVPHICRAEALL